MNSCNTNTLETFVPNDSNPWNDEKIQHLYRRFSFGIDKNELDFARTQSPEAYIDALIDNALSIPLNTMPDWVLLTAQDYEDAGLIFEDENQNYQGLMKHRFFIDLLNHGLKSRLGLFWSNHFVTQMDVYFCANYTFHYYDTIQKYALGNFKDFVFEIGLSSAMLVYLNGFENTLENPNENYARELYELFTLGENNGYTQSDIVETSKALTGYNYRDDFCSSIYFDMDSFNQTEKTIFDQSGNWNYDDVIDILFDERGELISYFICEKLYKYFVNPKVNEEIVQELADIFKVDFDISNLLRVLFKSEHFFHESNFGAIIKSPYDLTHNYIQTIDSTADFTVDFTQRSILIFLNTALKQEVFNPIDVAGWQGDKDWINSGTLTGRWQLMDNLIRYTLENSPEKLRLFAIQSSDNSSDPEIVTRSIIHRFVPKALHDTNDYNIATQVFKNNIPQNYFDDGLWDLNWDIVPTQVTQLLLHISKTPEFQLK